MAAPLVFIALLMGFSFLGETTTDMTYVTLTIQTPLKRVITPLDGFVPTRTDQIASIESRRQETRMPRRVTIITTTTVLLPTGNSREFTLGDGSEPPDLDAMKADFIFFRPRNLSDPEAPDPWAYSHTTAEQILDQARAVHTQTKPLHSPNQVGRTELHTSTTYVALWARIAMWTVPALIVGGLFVCISYHHRRGIMKVGLKHDAERRAT